MFQRRALHIRMQLVTLFSIMFTSIAFADDIILSDFSDKTATWKTWCEAQIDEKNGPVTFENHPSKNGSPSDKFITITAIEESLGGNAYDGSKCVDYQESARTAGKGFREDESDDSPDDLGPPVFESSQSAMAWPQASAAEKRSLQRNYCPGTVWDPNSPSSKPYCTEEKYNYALSRLPDGGEKMDAKNPVCMQRQEVRFHPKNKGSHHFYEQTRTYRIRFRLPEEKDICDRQHGLRWVNVQWKLKELFHGSNSPFLAQRFDDGYLFVTVQSKSCRCVVAAASELKTKFKQIEGRPLFCQWTGPKPEDPSCTPEKVNLQVKFGPKKWLKNTLGRWSQMTYSVKPHLKSGRIQVSQDGVVVSTITGMIGYKPLNEKTRVKFKFGQYRDYQPREHTIAFDEIEIGPVEN